MESGAKHSTESVQRASKIENDRADMLSDDPEGDIEGDGPIHQATEPKMCEDA